MASRQGPSPSGDLLGRMPDGPFIGLLYLLTDGRRTGLIDVREVGEGARDSVLVQLLSQLDGGRSLPRCLSLSIAQPVGPLEESIYSTQAFQHREVGYL